MYSYGPPHMAKQKQDDQLEPTYSSSVGIRDVALRTCQKRWTIGRSGERGSGISMLVAQHHDDSFKTCMICMPTPKWTIKERDWTAECLEAFEKIKKTLTSDLFLPHYNPDLEIIVASDTSLYDVGACIFHEMTDGTLKPIVHVSKALLRAEKNYSQIKKEALGIIFTVSKLYVLHLFIFMVDISLYKQTTSHYSPSLAEKKKRSSYGHR